MSRLRCPVAAALAALAVLVAIPATASAGAGGDGELTVDVELGGTSLGDDGGSIDLVPDEETVLQLSVENGTGDDVTVRKVRVAGSVLGMTFFTFTTRIDMVVEPGDEGDRQFTLDLTDLDGQARGLLAGRVELVGTDNEVLASEGFTADARGSLTSTYSLFGLVVGLLTAVLLLAVVQGLRKDTLPTNRFNRGLRFAEPGAGLGLTMTFTLSALRIVLVPAPLGLLFIVLGAGVGFAVGYTLSHADEDDAPPAPSVPGPTSVGEVLR